MQSAAQLQSLCEGSFCLEKASLYWAHWLTDCLFFYRLDFHNPAHSVGSVRHLARSCPWELWWEQEWLTWLQNSSRTSARWHLQPGVNTQMLVAPLCKNTSAVVTAQMCPLGILFRFPFSSWITGSGHVPVLLHRVQVWEQVKLWQEGRIVHNPNSLVTGLLSNK